MVDPAPQELGHPNENNREIALVLLPARPAQYQLFHPAWNGRITAKTTDHNLMPAPPPPLPPVFDDFTIRHMDAVEGQTLLLPCTVRSLGDKVVSWIRSRDLHILTSGSVTFSSDNRFEAVPSPAGDFWGLRMRGVHVSDTGQYECQVNTDPKMSLAINLTVSGVRKSESTNSKWVGRALIKGPSEVYVRDGSQVTFTCEISPLSVASLQSGAAAYGGRRVAGRGEVFMIAAAAKPRVRWLHDNKELLFEQDQQQEEAARISIDTHYGEANRKVTSMLKFSKTLWEDSGQYTCLQMSVKPDSVTLFVVEGEHPEAMQRDFPIPSDASTNCIIVFPSVVILLLFISIQVFI